MDQGSRGESCAVLFAFHRILARPLGSDLSRATSFCSTRWSCWRGSISWRILDFLFLSQLDFKAWFVIFPYPLHYLRTPPVFLSNRRLSNRYLQGSGWLSGLLASTVPESASLNWERLRFLTCAFRWVTRLDLVDRSRLDSKYHP